MLHPASQDQENIWPMCPWCIQYVYNIISHSLKLCFPKQALGLILRIGRVICGNKNLQKILDLNLFTHSISLDVEYSNATHIVGCLIQLINWSNWGYGYSRLSNWGYGYSRLSNWGYGYSRLFNWGYGYSRLFNWGYGYSRLFNWGYGYSRLLRIRLFSSVQLRIRLFSSVQLRIRLFSSAEDTVILVCWGYGYSRLLRIRLFSSAEDTVILVCSLAI